MFVWFVEYEGECVHLALSGSDKGETRSVVEDGKGEGDALWRGLGRVVEIGYPPVTFGEQLVAWEKRAGVAVRTDSEKDEVKDGEASRVLLGELANELLFVSICKFFEIVEKIGVDGVDVLRGDGDMVEQLGFAETVV